MRDLEVKGLLDRTLIIIASEFSRDALIEGKPGSNASDQATFKVEKSRKRSTTASTATSPAAPASSCSAAA